MRIRIFSGLAALAILLVITFANKELFAVTCFILALLAVNEFFDSFKKEGFNPMKIFGFLWCAAIPVIVFSKLGYFIIPDGIVFLAFFASTALLFAFLVFNIEHTSSGDISTTVLGTSYIVIAFLSMAMIRALPDGALLIWIAFIGAWATDTFSYFFGVKLGRHKILPLVSPKKSLEGVIAGVLGCIIVMVIFVAINHNFFGNLNIYLVVLLGSLCGLFSQLGDWAMSAFKRKSGVKDFGKFLPGHGGVLDRFDSILFICPLVYGFLSLMNYLVPR